MAQIANYAVTRANSGDWVTVGKTKLYQIKLGDAGSSLQLTLTAAAQAASPTPAPAPAPVPAKKSSRLAPVFLLLFGDS